MFSHFFFLLQIEMSEINEEGKKSTVPVREVTIDTSTSETPVIRFNLAEKRRQFMSQPSTVATRRQQAVCVRRAHKSYGFKSNRNIILDGLNMTVPKGAM